jgi:NAD-dependent dihydropyrimidine dehydrogenase PreA subunit
VDICPWKCIQYLSVEAIAEATNVADPRGDSGGLGMFVVDEAECTRCALCVDRCPTGVISLGKFAGSLAESAERTGVSAPWQVDSGQRDHKNGYAYGMRF